MKRRRTIACVWSLVAASLAATTTVHGIVARHDVDTIASDEQALFQETPNKTMWFTYFLAQAMEKNRPLTVEQAFRSAQEGMRTIVRRLGAARVQEPTLTDRALLPIFLVPTDEQEATRP